MEIQTLILPIVALVAGLALLVWSADLFISGSSSIATHLGMSPFLVGMIIVGFGTSAPELLVSALSSFQGNPGIALGNAYGSNIVNIGLILGITAIMRTVNVPVVVCKKELRLLMVITVISAFLLLDSLVSRLNAILLLTIFFIWLYRSMKAGAVGEKIEEIEIAKGDAALAECIPASRSVVYLVVGLIFLLLASRTAVWGAVKVATVLGVSDLVIGLTIVAIGTSLPELASSIAASRKGEHDIVLGNIVGSNVFNTLAVVGLAGVIHPINAERALLYRDISVMAFLTLLLWFLGFKFGRLSRRSGLIFVVVYFLYLAALLVAVLPDRY